jgi:CBS domain-containing protein
MTRDVVTMEVSKTAHDAANLMADKNISTLVLVRNGDPVGIVTERDFLRRVSSKDLKSSQVGLEEIMSSPLITVDPYASIEMAASRMAENKTRRLVVLQSGKVVGILTGTDLVRHMQESWNRRLDFLLDQV